MLEREEWQKRVDEAGSDEDEDIEGWEDGEEGKVKPDVKGKGKLISTPSIEEIDLPGNKRRRPAVDPFAASGAFQLLRLVVLYLMTIYRLW